MKIKLEKTKSFWLYVFGGVLAMILGGMLLPLWSNVKKDLFFKTWGALSVKIMISGLVLAYVFLYLVKRIRRYHGTPAQMVAIVELVLMVVIAFVCTVSQFVDDFSFGGPSQIFGLVLWVRGASGVFTGYYCDSQFVAEVEKKNKEKKNGSKKDDKKEEIDTDEEPRGRVDDFTVWRLSLAVVLISLGIYMFIKPVFEPIFLQWVFSITIVAVGLFFIVYGLALKPKKVRVKEIKVEEQAENGNGQGNLGKGEEASKLGKKEEVKALEEGRVKIKLDSSANAMTDTATIDAVSKDEINPSANALVPVEKKEEANKKDKKSKKKK